MISDIKGAVAVGAAALGSYNDYARFNESGNAPADLARMESEARRWRAMNMNSEMDVMGGGVPLPIQIAVFALGVCTGLRWFRGA